MGNEIDRIYTALKHGGYQRTLHYHNTPEKFRELYERQLSYISSRYHTVTPEMAQKRLLTGEGDGRKELVIGLFDGYRNQYEVLYPILERLGLTGWFLLVTDFLDTSGQEQGQKLDFYSMQYLPGEYADKRYAMSWEEAREIGGHHTLVNHSATHFRLEKDTDAMTLKYEIEKSHKRIVEMTGVCPKCFSWLYGAMMKDNLCAARMLKELDYHFLIGSELEYFGQEDPTPGYEIAQCRESPAENELRTEVENCETVMEHVGLFSAVPAILPFTRCGYVNLKRKDAEGEQLAEHFAALVQWLKEKRGLADQEAGNRALEVLAVREMGDGFPYH